MSPNSKRKVCILGVPMDLGQNRRGVDMGPSAVRYAGLQKRLEGLGLSVHDCGNVPVPVVEEIVETNQSAKAQHIEAVAQACQATYDMAAQCISPEDFAIFLGGDHSMSIGSVASMTNRGNIGVIWVDAHADFNTPETSISGNVHGMPVAALMGHGIDHGADILINVGHQGPKLRPGQIAMIGIRNVDEKEKIRLRESGIAVSTMTDIDEKGIGDVTRSVLNTLAGFDSIHVSLDMDSLDPEYAPGVGTPVRGGLTYREAHLLMEILANSGKVRSMDIVEINPILDSRNLTAELAVELAASLLGQRIL
jgi:arginase